MSEISAQAFEEFEALARLFGRTRVVLHELLAHGDLSSADSALLAKETLPHIEGVEAGFKARLRTSEGHMDELRELVLHGGLAVPEPRDDPEARAALIEAMQALSGAGGPRELIAAVGRDLAALEHARISMALLPRTEASAVRYPGRRSYADISPPRSPSEFAGRIEEVERTIWRAAAGQVVQPSDARWRRVYAFFDAGEQLSSGGLTMA